MKRSSKNPTRVLLPATVVILTLLLAVNMIVRHSMPTPNHEHDERAIAAHRELKELTLELVNERRSRSGVPPVELGNNPVAQIHAEHAAQGSTEWTLRTQQNSGIITSVHETTATCRACNRKQTFQNRKPTVVGKLLAAITRMLPEPPEARPGRQSANEEPEPAAAN